MGWKKFISGLDWKYKNRKRCDFWKKEVSKDYGVDDDAEMGVVKKMVEKIEGDIIVNIPSMESFGWEISKEANSDFSKVHPDCSWGGIPSSYGLKFDGVVRNENILSVNVVGFGKISELVFENGSTYGAVKKVIFLGQEGVCCSHNMDVDASLSKPSDVSSKMKKSVKMVNTWSKDNGNIVDKIKKQNLEEDVSVKFLPPSLLLDGSILVDIVDEVVKKGCSGHVLHSYGYFVGINLPFTEYNLRRMWRKFDLDDNISLGENGIWLFKFKMRRVLENCILLVNGVPLFVREWSPRSFQSKPKPSKVPLWISQHGITFELEVY
ncbi:hypothetical protein L6452_37675 [Arctium lappa]|uniref:Uncharacterized protein n=1 Tax=Arctium lappa TaxID=4217 RepID=A0ACB8Y3Q6_ARCLA|nr:hypothetical protein L6452_37675 [Arctium lappa]